MRTRLLRHVLTVCSLSCLAAARAWAQPSADATVHAVAYFETVPSARSTIESALHRYRDASLKEGGFLAMDVLAQSGRPGLYTVVESWRDKAAFDAHTAAPHVKAMREAFEAVRVSGYDERPYKTLSTAPSGGADTTGAVYVVSHVDIGGQGTDAPAILRTLAETSRTETGVLRFDILQHAVRANHFTVVEVWRTTAARDAHAAAAHTKAYRDRLLPLTGSPIDERLFTQVR